MSFQDFPLKRQCIITIRADNARYGPVIQICVVGCTMKLQYSGGTCNATDGFFIQNSGSQMQHNFAITNSYVMVLFFKFILFKHNYSI